MVYRSTDEKRVNDSMRSLLNGEARKSLHYNSNETSEVWKCMIWVLSALRPLNSLYHMNNLQITMNHYMHVHFTLQVQSNQLPFAIELMCKFLIYSMISDADEQIIIIKFHFSSQIANKFYTNKNCVDGHPVRNYSIRFSYWILERYVTPNLMNLNQIGRLPKRNAMQTHWVMTQLHVPTNNDNIYTAINSKIWTKTKAKTNWK